MDNTAIAIVCMQEKALDEYEDKPESLKEQLGAVRWLVQYGQQENMPFFYVNQEDLGPGIQQLNMQSNGYNTLFDTYTIERLASPKDFSGVVDDMQSRAVNKVIVAGFYKSMETAHFINSLIGRDIGVVSAHNLISNPNQIPRNPNKRMGFSDEKINLLDHMVKELYSKVDMLSVHTKLPAYLETNR
jgi:hypothetical protein